MPTLVAKADAIKGALSLPPSMAPVQAIETACEMMAAQRRPPPLGACYAAAVSTPLCRVLTLSRAEGERRAARLGGDKMRCCRTRRILFARSERIY